METLRRSKKEIFMHGDNLRDYEAMHRARTEEIKRYQKTATAFMRSKPYGERKERA